MTKIQIREATTTRVRAEFESSDIKPADNAALLLVLNREVRERNLGRPADFRIRAWDQRRGWIEHTWGGPS